MTAAEDKARAIDSAWKIHGAVVDWTAKVDTKANYTATIESALIVGTVAMHSTGRRFHDLHGAAVVFYWIGMGFLIAALVLSVAVVRPRLRRGKVKSEAPNNFIYFGHLRHWEPKELQNALLKEDLLPMLSRQLVATSKIAWQKHICVRWSVQLTAVGLLTLVGATIAR